MKMNRSGKWLPRAGMWSTTTLMLGFAMAACLTRPVGTVPPTTKSTFTSTQFQQAVDKIDILFAIDNSASMGDKQDILADAVPTLLNGLIYPHCVHPDTGALAPTDTSNVLTGRADPVKTKSESYGCPSIGGTQYVAEFTPVTDMHIGIVSSSLGSMGGYLGRGSKGESGEVCSPTGGGNKNDNGHLLARGADSTAIQNASQNASPPANFLAWFPESEVNTTNAERHPTPGNPINNSTNLQNYFKSLIRGTGQDGCGLEAQLESVYHFLIQPDPYPTAGIQLNGSGLADLGQAVDYDLLAQRAAFLRPDSLVAVIMLTDEDDSSVDPLSVGGRGFNFASKYFTGSPTGRTNDVGGTTAPLPTTACASKGPGDASCTTCAYKGGCAGSTSAICAAVNGDANCNGSGGGYYGATDDAMGVRFYRMKERFGVDPQFPISRYTVGFTSTRVPDRTTEHTVSGGNVSDYVGSPKCTNPLFAASLPTAAGQEICDLPRGTRDSSLVFFALIGGVPNQLLYGTKDDGTADYRPDDPDHNAMTAEKWKKVLGNDPIHYDYTDLDPHMVPSVTPRDGLTGSSATVGDNGTDPINGREWSTAKIDLQYACTFPLKAEKPCTSDDSCDCYKPINDQLGKNPPLCSTSGTSQIRAKAYPTIRQLEVVRSLGDQGIAASLCPVDPATTNAANADTSAPTYGYNPAVASIIARLKNALTQQCLPQSLRDETDAGSTDGSVPCLILAQLAPDGNQDCAQNGLLETDAAILKVFHDQQVAEGGSADGGLADRKVCTVNQLVKTPGETCKNDPAKGWCYVENANGLKPAGRCSQAIVFSAGTQDLSGARFSLQCIKQFSPGAAAGDTH